MDKKRIQIGKETFYYLDEGKGEKVLVLVHGNMSSGVHYKPLIEKLSSEYRLIAPDMRGFGDSTYNEPLKGLEDLSDDIIALLDALNITSYDVAGWSTGGAVALKMAAKRKESVKHVILIESCSYRGYPIFRKDENGAPIVGSYYETKEEMAEDIVQVKSMVGIFESGNTPIMKAVWDQAIYTVNKPNEEDDALYLSETMKQRNLVDIDWGLTTFNMSNFTNGVTLGDGSIKDVTCPVISFWGDKDIVVLEYMIDETIEALPNAKKVVLENSGHNPFVDSLEVLTNEIINFIE